MARSPSGPTGSPIAPRLRVLYLQPAASFGGAERQAAQNIHLLPRFGVDVLPVVGPGRQIIEFLEAAGVERYVFMGGLPDDPKAPRGPSAQAWLVGAYVRDFFRARTLLADEVRRARPDVILASRPFAWVIAGMVGRALGVPVVWRAGTQFEHWSQPPLLSLLSRLWPPRAAIYTSESIRRALADTVRAEPFVVHNGVDTERFSPARRAVVTPLRDELGLAPGAPVVGFVGRLSPEKGLGLLVEGCARLVARRPDVRVVIAGDSAWRGRFEQRLAAAGLTRAVRLAGFILEIERVYATADVVISTSEAEGCPNALLEAMAMGRPVVATEVGGTAEVVRDGVDGLLVPPGDAEALASRVDALLGAAAWREAMGERAARHVADHFSLEAQVGRLAEVLHWAGSRPTRIPSEIAPGQRVPSGSGARPGRGGDASLAALGGVAARSDADR